MITSRRAEQFDDLLEGRISEAPAELTELLSFAERVWSVPAPEPRADFAASLRERLMAEAPTAMADGATDHRLTVHHTAPARRSRQRRLAAAVAVFSVAGAATGTAFASEGALPGDTLYPVKRLVESAHAALALGDSAKGSIELGQATTRLQEATELAKDGRTTAAADALHDFVSQATKGSGLLTDAGNGTGVHTFTAASVDDLAKLGDLLPADVLAPAVQALLQIDKAVTAALPDSGDGITQLPTSLASLLANAASAVGAPKAAGDAHQAPASTPSGQARPGTTTDAGTPAAPSSGSSPQAKPSTVGGALGATVDGVGDGVGGAVSGLGATVSGVGSALPSPVGGVVSGLGDTVGGLGDTVGGLLNGVGDALGGSSK